MPPRYDAASYERYPVLYLLHGATADETQWEDVGIGQGADCLLAAHRMRPALIVLLDAGIAEGRPNGPSEVQRFVLLEAIPTIDRRFRTIADRQHRAIGGISRGGGWALQIAADHPDRFSAVGGHSPAVHLTERQRVSLSSREVRVWLDVGTSEALRSPVTGLARTLRDGGADVSLRVWLGAHDRRYWSHHVQAYLRFYTARW
ncbi:MAG: alpha/beta hydrolase-fold protein [Actinomycetota bacterium]|nr:alpha/beta hydrolase-fold protein [Actinomycetota bacterium]